MACGALGGGAGKRRRPHPRRLLLARTGRVRGVASGGGLASFRGGGHRYRSRNSDATARPVQAGRGMTAVLKCGSGEARVRPISALACAEADDPANAFREALEAARARASAAEGRIEALEAACLQAERDGEARGREIGRSEAADESAQALEQLATGIAEARERFEAELRGMERLAVQIARQCLEAVFGDPQVQAELVELAIRRQVQSL